MYLRHSLTKLTVTMEGQCETSFPKKRVLKFFPCLLTILITVNLNAKNVIPLPKPALFNNLTFKAVPIFANTLATFNNLKSVVTAETVSSSMVTESNAKLINNKEVAEATSVVNNISKEERRKDIANFAESHTDGGYKYRYGGTTLERGIDCSGFTRYVLKYFDIKASRTSEEQYDNGNKVPVEVAKPGDLVFFGGKGYINHVALVVSNDSKGLVVVHSTNRGIVKDNITESKHWRSKLLSHAVNIVGN